MKRTIFEVRGTNGRRLFSYVTEPEKCSLRCKSHHIVCPGNCQGFCRQKVKVYAFLSITAPNVCQFFIKTIRHSLFQSYHLSIFSSFHHSDYFIIPIISSFHHFIIPIILSFQSSHHFKRAGPPESRWTGPRKNILFNYDHTYIS